MFGGSKNCYMIIRDKRGRLFIVTKGSTQQKVSTLINICAPNTGPSTYIKQLLMDIKREIECDSVTVGDINTRL